MFTKNFLNTFPLHKLKIEKTLQPKKKTPFEKLIFGQEFTDHMLEIDWQKEEGWGTPLISPIHPLSLMPSISALHYGLQLFEGMKAYKDKKNQIRLFRPNKNYERMVKSASRLVLPTFDYPGFLGCLSELLKLDNEWIPKERGYSLYIRPTLIGTNPTLGVSPSPKAKFFIIMSPVGPYYPEGWKPVKLLADPRFVRSWPGGTGDCKIGANYAGGILPQYEAAQKGYSQVVWLLGENHRITEVGTMNIFIFWKNKNGETELITPPLDGTILPGVTRDSIIELTKSWNEFKIIEKAITMKELIEAHSEGRIFEIFGAGTAAVVSPIKTIGYLGKDYEFPVDPIEGIGPLAKRIHSTITGIQYGEILHEWSVVIS
jgi:branched-chain amino acid aminotransferase